MIWNLLSNENTLLCLSSRLHFTFLDTTAVFTMLCSLIAFITSLLRWLNWFFTLIHFQNQELKLRNFHCRTIITNAWAVIITLYNWWLPNNTWLPGVPISNRIKIDKTVPKTPANKPKIKYNEPISLWFVEQNHLKKNISRCWIWTSSFGSWVQCTTTILIYKNESNLPHLRIYFLF